MDEHKLTGFLEANPEYRDILKKAVMYEDSHPADEYLIGWAYAVGLTERQLQKLAYEGIVEVSFKSGRLMDYRLTDSETVKKVLGPVK